MILRVWMLTAPMSSLAGPCGQWRLPTSPLTVWVGVWRGRQRWTLTGSTLPGPGGAGAPAAASRSVQISAEWCLNISVDNITAARARVLGAGSVRRGRGEDGARLPQRQVPGPGLQHSQVDRYSGDSQDISYSVRVVRIVTLVTIHRRRQKLGRKTKQQMRRHRQFYSRWSRWSPCTQLCQTTRTKV